MRYLLAAFAVALTLAACGAARDSVTPPPTPTTPETWLPLPTVATSAPTGEPVPDPMPPATTPSETLPFDVDDVYEEAMAVVRAAYDWPAVLSRWTVERHNERPGRLATTFVAEHRIEVYARAGESLERQAYVIAHELGHALDIERVSPFERAIWESHRGLSAAHWFPAAGESDFATGAGDFAESFAFTLVPCASCWASELGDPPSPAERELLGALIR